MAYLLLHMTTFDLMVDRNNIDKDCIISLDCIHLYFGNQNYLYYQLLITWHEKFRDQKKQLASHFQNYSVLERGIDPS